jgi:glutamate racemase
MNPDTLVLGCTHYPLLRPLFARAVQPGVNVIDSAESVAQTAAQQLNSRGALVSAGDATETEIRCFATDSVEKFERLGPRFLGRSVGQVELIDLGG